ncbi:replication factor C subunit 1 [Nematocida minor]|uniref:replication factor C subunit 1 n=1 Tax=Nematocida minor TaxID=1912983 RepID=UPI00221E6FBD|nr:replication factor C subunit 1 [Nematocida minor]KAI5191685.1 replication factor C subunit 1 [Nematocida minor]
MKRKEDDLPYTGRTFVVTGTTALPRDTLVNRIRELGGKVTVGVSGSTTYLVTGADPGPAKLKKALAAGTKILSEEEFTEMSSHYVIQPIEVKKVKTANLSHERWTDKYAPQSLSEVVGNSGAIKQLKTHLLSMSLKPILLAGPSGVGKTLSVYLAAKELGLSLIEYNGSDYRSKQEISIVKGLSTQQSLTREVHLHKNKVLLMEEIENMTANDRGGLQEILSLFKKTSIPIILTANDKSSQNIKTIVAQCKVLQYSKIDSRSAVGVLKNIANKEGISIPENTLMQIAVTAAGDVRYAVNMLQYLSKKQNISSEDITVMRKHFTTASLFDVTKEILLGHTSPSQKINLFFDEPVFSLLMVFENYLEGCTLKEAADVSDSLSMAEIVSNRMLAKDEKRLFPVAAYYTAVKPRIKLSSRIMFSKYLGFASSMAAKKKKINKVLNELSERGMQGGWSVIYELFNIMNILKNSKVPEITKKKYIRRLQIDKNVLQILNEVTGAKIKANEMPLLKTKKDEM